MLHLTLVTQDKELLSLEVDSLTADTTSGQVTILPRHVPLMSKLTDTELIYRIKGKEYSIAVSGGFLNVEPHNKITVLADSATRSEDISELKAEEAKRKAHETMQNEKLSATEMKIAEGNLRRAILELKVVKRRKGGY